MRAIACPSCHETERLSGRRLPDHALEISCTACGHTWQRDATRRCNHCGSTDLEYAPRPLWAKGRGDQHTPAGRIDAYACRDCGGQDVTARRPAADETDDAGEPRRAGGAGEVPVAGAPTTPPAGRPTAGEPPARRLRELQRLDAEIDRLGALADHLPEQRHADASAAKLSAVAKALTALAQESQRLQAAGQGSSPDAERVREALEDARRQGEEFAALHRRRLAAVTAAAASVEAALGETVARREALAVTLPSLIDAYESTRRRVRDPVAQVVDIGTCGGCRIVISPSELERARELAATGLARCPGCHRFLVFEI